jgi:mRNA interferase RelE/StbE
MHELFFSPAAERYFKKLKNKQLREKFRNALKDIQENPYAGQPKRDDLTGVYGYDFYYGGTNYEIAYASYEIDGRKVVVLLAGTRENFYEELKRIYKK